MFLKYIVTVCLVFFFFTKILIAQSKLDNLMPVRGFCISAPKPKELNRFIQFIDKELATRGVNTLILRIDFGYQFKTHPELRDNGALSQKEVKELLKICQKHKIQLIPQINLLGHQSWAEKTHKLLKVYPQFDETPHVKMPRKFIWPNKDSLYCKSYCSLNEGVHKVVFDLVDEICEAFESTAFHAGMDEVFYIGDDKCPRCAGKNKAQLYADEVNRIEQHLALKTRKLWIWGDRLLDGKAQDVGMWEGSMNNTFAAIDKISKNVLICDWHYEKAHQTPIYFVSKGFKVVTSVWQNPSVAVKQTQDMVNWRSTAPQKKQLYQGMMQTIWSNTGAFLDEFYSKKDGNTQANCFRAVFKEINTLSENQ
jgi:N-acetyl-beta-hexosaminidase